MKDIPNDIVARAAEGDLDAFKEIYTIASGFVHSVAMRITNNHADAEEVTQDVFMKVHKNLKDFQFKSSLKTWLYRVTVNTAINKYNTTAKEMNRRVDYDTTISTVSARDRMEEIIDTEAAEHTAAALLNILNPDQRACLVLREIQGLSYAEIAEAMKININTVRSRLKRARMALLATAKKR